MLERAGQPRVMSAGTGSGYGNLMVTNFAQGRSYF